jgi:hypothetical protein
MKKAKRSRWKNLKFYPCGVGLSALCLFSPSVSAQTRKDKWLRVYTGDDSIIEVNSEGLTFNDAHTVRVLFRTILNEPEGLLGKPETKYKSRLETTEFKLNERTYRLTSATLLDTAGKVVLTHEATEKASWRVMKAGGMMSRLFDSIRELPPLGGWQVTGFRSGGDIAVPGPDEFEKLLASKIRLSPERADVGAKSCSSPSYLSESLGKEDFIRKLGVSMEALGFKNDRADAIVLKCAAWRPPQSLLLKLDEGGMLMLWDGLFLELKRFDGVFPASDRSTLKRREPRQ